MAALALAPAGAGAAESPPCFVSVGDVVRMPADGTYAVRLNSLAPTTRDVRFTFFSKAQSFTAEATAVSTSFDRSGSLFAISKPVFVAVPTSESLVGADVAVLAGDKPTACLSWGLEVTGEGSAKGPFASEALREFGATPGGAKPVILTAILRGPDPLPTCFEPYTDARAVRLVQPIVPNAAFDGVSRFVQIFVIVAPDGSAAWTSVYKSSGLQALDLAAKDAARSSEFAPATFRCRPTTGMYLFRLETP